MAYKYTYEEKEEFLYVVKDGNNKSCASFRLIDAPLAKRPACKHMDVNIYKEVAEEVIEQKNITLLMSIYRFIFNSVLEITHELKGIKLCKIYTDDRFLFTVYLGFAKFLGKNNNYSVVFYGNWIEISKKP